MFYPTRCIETKNKETNKKHNELWANYSQTESLVLIFIKWPSCEDVKFYLSIKTVNLPSSKIYITSTFSFWMTEDILSSTTCTWNVVLQARPNVLTADLKGYIERRCTKMVFNCYLDPACVLVMVFWHLLLPMNTLEILMVNLWQLVIRNRKCEVLINFK